MNCRASATLWTRSARLMVVIGCSILRRKRRVRRRSQNCERHPSRRRNMSSNIETVLQEKRVFPPPAAFVRQANISGMEAYRKMVAEAERDFEGFWAKHAREALHWSKPFTKVLDESKAPFFRWFYDGELNASYNCLDRHLKTQPDKVAIIFE